MAEWISGIPTIYFWGVFGSAATEIVALYQSVKKNKGVLQEPFTSPAYMILRVLLAFIAGFIPVITGATTALAAVYMGASAPLYFDHISRGAPPIKYR